MTADFGERLHALLLLAAAATYTITALGLLALGQHVSRCKGESPTANRSKTVER